jgi:hypothetical protein
MLIVPINKEKELLESLLTNRCGNKEHKIWRFCSTECYYHIKNDHEVHYQGCDSGERFYIAERWLNFFIVKK